MAAFNASSIVEELAYDFSKFGGGSGTIAEPTDALILAFGQALTVEEIRQHGLRIDLAELETEAERLAAVEKAGNDPALAETSRIEAQIHADLCAGTPSADDMLKLPQRIRHLFYAWLRDEVLNPEAVAADGNKRA